MRTLRYCAAGLLLAVTATVYAGKPIRFIEGPFVWDDVYDAGFLCEFPVRIQGTIEVDQTWFVSSFPPAPGEAWSTHSRFRGTETWTNLDTGTSAPDRFSYTILHEFLEFELLRTVQTGNSTNVKGGKLVEAGRVVWEGEDLSVPIDFRGRWIQFPDFNDWYAARCASIGS